MLSGFLYGWGVRSCELSRVGGPGASFRYTTVGFASFQIFRPHTWEIYGWCGRAFYIAAYYWPGNSKGSEIDSTSIMGGGGGGGSLNVWGRS